MPFVGMAAIDNRHPSNNSSAIHTAIGEISRRDGITKSLKDFSGEVDLVLRRPESNALDAFALCDASGLEQAGNM